ncbi:cryptochrome/photolyase family protein [Acidisphaera sp. L21]|uniref:cryptochrome/photolyase family protein n=1 Tax=Acidisphaera sp. L21 TaxID=1641851 RepID=UPI00131E9660|nr:cryptochrome/photolyase family protein [Acidisphaera sp. L21]
MTKRQSKPQGTLRVVLGDQCSATLSALADLDPAIDTVLMAEVRAECTYVRHHQTKIVLVLSAMRHFARALRARGVTVEYITLDDPANTHSLRGELVRAVARIHPRQIVITECGEWRLAKDMEDWHDLTGLEVDIRPDTRFLCSIRDFRTWARGKNNFRMEFFYREMRRRHGVLMDGDGPVEGRWNFDAENRKRLPKEVHAPAPPAFPPDTITTEIIAMVRARFGDHFGTCDGFSLPVTAADAHKAMADFITHRLPQFGDWQDAMKTGEPTLFHALVSTSINCGLLTPIEVITAAEAAFRAGTVALNGAEGFIRQILGWREFVRGIYWLRMPEYGQLNALEATRKLPQFYWDASTRMNCLHQAISDTREHAYAHHIQRLMITGNFALLAGLDPVEVDEWYLIVYADAYEWVEMPNTRGMALFADGGIMGSKPYAASGAYINRMSDYCGSCHYDVKDAAGERGCPFNALYWDFIARHAARLGGNIRMAMPLRNMERMPPERLAQIRTRADSLLAMLDAGQAI